MLVLLLNVALSYGVQRLRRKLPEPLRLLEAAWRRKKRMRRKVLQLRMRRILLLLLGEGQEPDVKTELEERRKLATDYIFHCHFHFDYHEILSLVVFVGHSWLLVFFFPLFC